MENKNPFKNIQDKVFDMEHRIINNIYVDMELLQDLKFGALLSFVSVKEELEYIYSKLNDYNNRIDNNICEYFPALKLTEDMLVEAYSDKKRVYKICGISPFTTAYEEFLSYLTAVLRHNKASGGVKEPTISLNISDVDYPDDILNMFIEHFKPVIPRLQFNVTKYKRYTYPTLDFIKHDAFFLYELQSMLSEGSPTSLAFAQNGAFFGKKIFTPTYIDKKLHTNPDDYGKVLVSTEAGLNIYCDFKYIPNFITITGANNG
jgi:hypothetical protein